MSHLLVGFDSVWTANNAGGLVGAIFDNAKYKSLGVPIKVNFQDAEKKILEWQNAHAPSGTLLLIDQPTIVRNAQGQRPVENLVSSSVSLRHGGMQPANTGRTGMFDADAPIWPFLRRFGGPADPISFSMGTKVFETYPVLVIIALDWLLPDERPTGCLPKYNPARNTFQQDDWRYLCSKLAKQFRIPGLEEIAGWIDSNVDQKPSKGTQDCLDACICLLVAMYLAEGKSCMMIGQQDSGAIVAPDSKFLAGELRSRCKNTNREPGEWLYEFRFPTIDSRLAKLCISLENYHSKPFFISER